MHPYSTLPEDFVQYLWKHRLFDLSALQTTDGQSVTVQHPGRLNRDQGPDFSEASLRIGGLVWHGQVEIHLRSEQWYQHRHHEDPGYNHTVLHVVLHSSGRRIRRQDGTYIPEVELAPYLGRQAAAGYGGTAWHEAGLACQPLLPEVPVATRRAMVERSADERLAQRVDTLRLRLEGLRGDWQQVLFEETLALMGGPVNQEVFRLLGRRLSARCVYRHRHERAETEALLLGAAGLLPAEEHDKREGWLAEVAAHWQHLRHKYQVPHGPLPLRYLRMRPGAFPEVRLAQAAALWALFDDWLALLGPAGWQELREQEIHVSDYWAQHSRLGQPSAKPRPKPLGESQKSVLITNVFLPLGYLYQQAHGHPDLETWLAEAWRWPRKENNRYTRLMKEAGFPHESARHSQGLLRLYRHYCQGHRCRHCAVGQHWLGRNPNSTKLEEPLVPWQRRTEKAWV